MDNETKQYIDSQLLKAKAEMYLLIKSQNIGGSEDRRLNHKLLKKAFENGNYEGMLNGTVERIGQA